MLRLIDEIIKSLFQMAPFLHSFSITMKNLWQNRLSSWFRSCSVCHLDVSPIGWLCSHCWKKLRSFYLPPGDMIREQGGLTHLRLFDWNEENDLFVRLFLNSLKKAGPCFVFNTVVLDFLHRIVQVHGLPLEAVLIPAPARSLRHFQDHAFSLAFSFSHLSGLSLCNPLLRLSPVNKDQSQKQKTKKERRKVRFSLKEDVDFNNKKIIFVDDVLTTGATAQAAHQTLKKPKQFVIFTLAWRSDYFC